MTQLMPVGHARLPQYAVQTLVRHQYDIRPLCRVESTTLTTQCRQAGLPIELAELCASLLASVTDDLVAISTMPKNRIERSKRMERVLMACQEPAASALRVAIAASPLNGKACVRHWDVVCDKREIGKMAWLLNMPTDAAYQYSRQIEKRT